MKISCSMLAGASLLALGCFSALAQQVTGVPGSPGATTTIDGKQLPPPDPKFGGVIKEKASKSKAWWAPRVVPPKGAPNVLLIMTDDLGFGAPGTFGGVVPTPALDRIASAGVRYTNFHSTSLCSPTRAAIITGRNHHSAGFGVVGEIATGFPGYDSIIPMSNGTIGTILKENGYATSWFGKDHNTPFYQSTQAGPFDQWPNGMGFDYFYGFVGGDASQWQPNLFRNTTAIYPFQGNPGWNLETAMADEAIQLHQGTQGHCARQAILCLLRAGRHPCAASSDAGVDQEDQRHALVRRGLEQAARDDLRQPEAAGHHARERQANAVAERTAAVGFAQFGREEALHQASGCLRGVPRVHRPRDRPGHPGRRRPRRARQHLDHLHQRRQRRERRRHAQRHTERVHYLQWRAVPVKDQFLWYPFWGSERTFPHFAAGWAWAMDTPFKWVKQVASHFGGTAQGMAMSWPGHINDVGGIRRQFHHVIDIVPTILEATGIPATRYDQWHQAAPDRRREHGVHVGQGERQRPDPAHDAILRDARQSRHLSRRVGSGHDAGTLPWELSTATPPDVITGYNWELYNVQEDPTEFNDLAAKMPEKLKEMQALFYSEAKKYDVLPLDNSTLARWNTPRPSLTAGRTVFTYSGELTGVPASAAPSILNKSYTITAEVEIPEGGAEGMIVTEGGRFGGYGLFLSKGEFGVGRGKVVFLYNLLDLKRTIWEGPELGAGKHTVVFDFKSDGPGLGKGGTGVLYVDGKEVARNSMEHTTPITFPEDETFDIGQDTRTGARALEYRYDVPFKFTGKINKLTFKLEPEKDAKH